MDPKVVQISFKLNMSGKDYVQAIAPLAQVVADVAGLQWKIWLLNESTREAGGIYLFEDENAANAFLSGPLIAQLTNAPSITDVCVAQFNVLGVLTSITRGPVNSPCSIPGKYARIILRQVLLAIHKNRSLIAQYCRCAGASNSLD